MDFIERLFHISPDGGTGATEAIFVLLVAVITIVVALILFSNIRRSYRR